MELSVEQKKETCRIAAYGIIMKAIDFQNYAERYWGATINNMKELVMTYKDNEFYLYEIDNSDKFICCCRQICSNHSICKISYIFNYTYSHYIDLSLILNDIAPREKIKSEHEEIFNKIYAGTCENKPEFYMATVIKNEIWLQRGNDKIYHTKYEPFTYGVKDIKYRVNHT
jgi:hypothetical protein